MEGIYLQGITTNELKELISASVRDEISKITPPNANKRQYGGRGKAAEIMGVGLPTVDKYIKEGVIKAKRLGGRLLIDLTYIDENLPDILAIKGKRG